MDQFIFQRKRSFWAQTTQSVMPPCRMSLTAEVIGYIVRVEQAERIISVCSLYKGNDMLAWPKSFYASLVWQAQPPAFWLPGLWP